MGMPIIKNSCIKVGDAVADLIESIALQEAGLAHIINAEGEKLQKVIFSKNVCTRTLLETNESVEKMIEKITKLEVVLQNKLTDAKDILKQERKRNDDDVVFLNEPLTSEDYTE